MKGPLKIQSSPKCKARKKFRRAVYDGYVSKKFFTQRSSWDEMWIFKGFLNPTDSFETFSNARY
jgi:hypothetical protein